MLCRVPAFGGGGDGSSLGAATGLARAEPLLMGMCLLLDAVRQHPSPTGHPPNRRGPVSQVVEV